MTIHKAKGLGFDVVIVPGLHRKTRPEQSRLLTWIERSIPPDEITVPDEISEIITHLAFYAGWPTAATAIGIARKVFEQADTEKQGQ